MLFFNSKRKYLGLVLPYEQENGIIEDKGLNKYIAKNKGSYNTLYLNIRLKDKTGLWVPNNVESARGLVMFDVPILHSNTPLGEVPFLDEGLYLHHIRVVTEERKLFNITSVRPLKGWVSVWGRKIKVMEDELYINRHMIKILSPVGDIG